jgi:hypothetical protein
MSSDTLTDKMKTIQILKERNRKNNEKEQNIENEIEKNNLVNDELDDNPIHKRNRYIQPLSDNNIRIKSISEINNGELMLNYQHIVCYFHPKPKKGDKKPYIIFLFDSTKNRAYIIRDYHIIKPFIKDIYENVKKRNIDDIIEYSILKLKKHNVNITLTENEWIKSITYSIDLLKKLSNNTLDYNECLQKHDIEFNNNNNNNSTNKRKRVTKSTKLDVKINNNKYNLVCAELELEILTHKYEYEAFKLRYLIENHPIKIQEKKEEEIEKEKKKNNKKVKIKK